MDSSSGFQRSYCAASPPTKITPSPLATMPLVPLMGQSRKTSPRAAVSRARRSVSEGEMVLICTIGWPALPAAVMPCGPRMASSTVASDGRIVQTTSAARATSPADFAGVPPTAASRSMAAVTTSYPTTACPAARSREATASPSNPTPTMPTVVIALAVLAGRVIPRVRGLLQVLVGLPVPELRDVGEGVDDGVLQPAADPLHLADVDVHDRVAVVVEAHGAARDVGEADLAEGAEELVDVLDVAP